MHSTTILTAGQTFHFHSQLGDTLYLNAGSALICPAPAWLETPYFEEERMLREGEPYVTGNSGWMTITTVEGCEFIRIAPASRMKRWMDALQQSSLLGKFPGILQLKRWLRPI
ncbi:hypothetical protein ACO0LO_07255 [Undibacterium sp. TJN25]|uniref:hypothetical protein n=1 Tax=Undibacterium sp. TJN25 TaxID=3413056 RepID=UPI003BEFF624